MLVALAQKSAVSKPFKNPPDCGWDRNGSRMTKDGWIIICADGDHFGNF